MQNKLLPDLRRILKKYYPDREIRESLLREILSKFQKMTELKYQLNTEASLILRRDERKPSWKQRYYDSPFPLLSCVERYQNSIGCWNEELKSYGLKSRSKINDPREKASNTGTHIYLLHTTSINLTCNKYLKSQYKRLERYRNSHSIISYWNLSWDLMSHSWSYRIASLGSWKRLWYKELSFKELRSIFIELNKILQLAIKQTTINNVWIESPKGKWRQLCIPPKGWRLYFHMLNQFISYIYSPCLNTSIYHGFLYQRGCKSWWEDTLWSKILVHFDYVSEVDLSSGFPNFSLLKLRECLLSDRLLPSPLIDLILTHLKSPSPHLATFPTITSYIEDRKNKTWRDGDRSLPMGIGISPILFVILQRWGLQSIKLWNNQLNYKWYADDGLLTYQWKGLEQFAHSQRYPLWRVYMNLLLYREPLIAILNRNPLLQEIGMKFCEQKSKVVKHNQIWINPLSSLGLQVWEKNNFISQYLHRYLDYDLDLELKLRGNTRGKGNNPLTKKYGTKGSQTRLEDLGSHQLTLSHLTDSLRPYFGLIQNLLYASESLNPKRPPQSKWGRIKGGSILMRILRLQKSQKLNLSEPLNSFTAGVKITQQLLTQNLNHTRDVSWGSRLERNLQLSWERCPGLPEDKRKIPNPLRDKKVRLDDYFYKIGELNLSKEELNQLTTEYESYLNSLKVSMNKL